MITGNIFRDAIISACNNICSQKSQINDLNIFPVPDGDTGTNMSMTISASAKELAKLNDLTVSEVAAKNASLMLRGARGNSGVILSLLFRGIAKGFEGKTEVNGKDIVNALGIGVEAIYKAVMKPTEGTILTIARVAYEKALEFCQDDSDAVEVFKVICDAGNEALKQTPEMLHVLKKAGVVDAGGKGLCVIFEGMLSVIENGIIIESTESTDNKSDVDTFRSAAAEFDEVINFTYCTEFIVGRNPEITTDPLELRKYLETIGDCVVVVDDEEIIKVHVHTEQPNNALGKGLEFGQLLTVKVENMREQHKNVKAENDSKKASLQAVPPTEEYGFVAVAAGNGLADLFKDLGCNNVVSGGQSMNPSTDSIYEAIMATPAKKVFVLPNNKNIIMAAQQTVDMVKDREVIVLPLRTIPQGISAMLAFDPEATVEDNKAVMVETAGNVQTGQVTFAARDSEFGGKKVKEGDIIALNNGKLTISDKTPVKALYKLAKEMITRETSIVTVIAGEDTTEQETQEAVALLQKKFPNIDIIQVDGRQPVYYFILGVE